MALARRFVRNERGAAMVELAIVMGVVFLPLVFGIVEFGRGVFAKTAVTAAAREGVRYAIVHGTESGTPATQTDVSNYVKSKAQISPIVVTYTFTPDETPGSTATVTVSYNYVPIVHLIPSRTITSTSQQVISF